MFPLWASPFSSYGIGKLPPRWCASASFIGSGPSARIFTLARLGAAEDDMAELRANACQVDHNDWPGPLVQLFCGELTPNEAFAAAQRNDMTARERGGETAFYLGERALLAGDTASAKPLLHEAKDACPSSFIECWAADAELRRLARQEERGEPIAGPERSKGPAVAG